MKYRFPLSIYSRLTLVTLLTLILSFLSLGCEDKSEDGSLNAGSSEAGERAGESSGGAAEAGESGGSTEAGSAEAGESGGTSEAGSHEGPPELEADPFHFGPSAVGYQSEEITYSPDWLPETRTLRLALWFPAVSASGSGLARYPLFSTQIAQADATPRMIDPAPLLVYSHGAKVWPELGSFMAEFFASHGWVVAAVTHAGDSLGSLSGDRPDELYALRPLDLSAALDYLEQLPADHPLRDRVDTHRAVVSGHSFGGYTTFVSAGARFDMDHLRNTHCQERGGSLCEALEGELGSVMEAGLREPRFLAAIPQSAGNFDFLRGGTSETAIPTLMITATRDQACTEEGSNQPFWGALSSVDSTHRGQHRRLSFLNAGHATFTMACVHLPALEQEDGCGPDFTPVLEAHQVMLAYSLLFARAYALGDQSALNIVSSEEGALSDELEALPNWVEWLSPSP